MAKDLDLLLVNVGGTRTKVYQDLSKRNSAIEPPFWAALVGGYMRKKGFNIDIIDANAENLSFEETAEVIASRDPKLTGLVVYGQQANTSTPIMFGVRQLCNQIKEREPDRRVIVSGWHPSALPERTMLEEKCDFVARGPEFYTIEGLLRGESSEKIPGLFWRENGVIKGNERAEIRRDLSSELSEVAWDLLPMDKYRAFNWLALHDLDSKSKYASMSTSLGCPYTCKFCAIHSTFGNRKIKSWSPEWVFNQLDTLVGKYGIKHLKIIDELFILNPRHYKPIVEGIIERGYDLNMCAFARVDTVLREDSLDRLKRAGINWFELGIESGNNEIRRNVSKGSYTKDQIRTAVGKIKDAGINICGNFMFGLPGDTLETMQETLDFAIELNCEYPFFFCTMALPGSELYQEALEKGLRLPDNWAGYATQSYDFVPFPTEHLTSEQILRFRDDAWQKYYTNPKFKDFIEKKFGIKAREHIERTSQIKLRRKILGD